jgi:hypothetical protein
MRPRRLKGRFAPALVAALFGAALTMFVATPAFASATYIGAFTFTKNSSAPDNSTLNLTIREIINGVPKPPTINVTVRSGSGNGTTNSCVTDQGWLPNGTYHIQEAWTDYPGTTVTKHAFELNDAWCYNNSVKRTALFIHSSYPWSANHYFSAGCIKVNNTDIDTLFNDYKAYFPIDKLYPTDTPKYGIEATGGVPGVVVVVQ